MVHLLPPVSSHAGPSLRAAVAANNNMFRPATPQVSIPHGSQASYHNRCPAAFVANIYLPAGRPPTEFPLRAIPPVTSGLLGGD